MPGIYDQGEVVETQVTVTGREGEPGDPDTLTFSYRPPGGQWVPTTYGVGGPIERDDVGIYRADVDTTPSSGEWAYKWVGVGKYGGARGPVKFIVRGDA